jgi:hypothetical protein
MKLLPLLIAAALAALPQSGRTQGVADDARCLFLSNAFASQATDPGNRQLAISTGAFFLGRLDGRATPAAIRSAFNANRALTVAQAKTMMNACVARASRADTQMRAVMGPLGQGR